MKTVRSMMTAIILGSAMGLVTAAPASAQERAPRTNATDNTTRAVTEPVDRRDTGFNPGWLGLLGLAGLIGLSGKNRNHVRETTAAGTAVRH